MKLRLISSGKGAVLSGQVNADLYIDCRGIVNPFRDPTLAGHHGSSQVLKDWMRKNNSPYIGAAEDMIEVAIHTAGTRNSFSDPNKPLTVCFFCLAGQHRSPAMKHVVAEDFKANNIEVEVA